MMCRNASERDGERETEREKERERSGKVPLGQQKPLEK